jgi:hypothetical protein
VSAGQTAAYWKSYCRRRSTSPHLAERERARGRESMQAARGRQRQTGRTFAQLYAASPYPDPASLRHVLNEEVAGGRILYHSATRRYALNRAAFPADLLAALAALGRVQP